MPALAAAECVLRIREPEWHQHRLFKGSNIDLWQGLTTRVKEQASLLDLDSASGLS
jgi:hypothetical protein